MKKINPNFKQCVSKLFSFILLLLITLSLTINPVAAIAANKTASTGSGALKYTNADVEKAAIINPAAAFIPATVFSNPTLITVPDNTGAQMSAQSAITASGLSGSVASVTVTLNNINAPGARDLDFLLVGPGGQQFVFMSDVGGLASPTVNATITLSDAAATQLTQSGAIPSGTFRPTDFGVDTFPAPAPAGPYSSAAPNGAATFTNVFGGTTPANGIWTLYVADDASSGGVNATINNGWSIDITTNAAAATTTMISSSLNPSNTNQAVTFTATVTSGATVNSGAVTFTDSTTGATLCNNVAVNGSGVATCLVPAGTFTERVHTIMATYNGNATFATSNANLQQTVNTATVQMGNTFTNPGAITIADAGAGSTVPYPSNIIVSGLTGSISRVTLSLNVNFSRTNDIDLLLVGPGGQTYVFFSDAGGLVASNGVITLDDTAALPLPTSGSIAPGTYRPSDYTNDSDNFPAPAPVGPYNMAPTGGVGTFASVYGGTAPNGTWRLYATDDTGSGAVSQIINSWGLTFTTSGDAVTTTVLTSTPNPSFTNQAVLFTATVTSGGNPVTVGTVTFRNGATILCSMVALNPSGQATCNAPAGTFAEGDFVITADYNGVPGQFNISNGSTTQTVSSPTVITCTNFANNAGITIPNSLTGNPYPSRINVTGLGGTISKVTLTMNGINAPNPDHVDFLLVGPLGQKFLFMGDAGGAVPLTGVNITLDDDAATQLPDSTAITSGTYRPASYAGGDTFPAPAPPAPYNPAAPDGTGTFANTFNGSNPNGLWSLYSIEDTGDGLNTTIANWSLTFTLAPVATTTTVTTSLSPSVFGQPVTLTATVTTAGLGTPTGNVQFFDGAASLGIVALNASGVATLMTSSLSVATHTITAQYAGAVTACNGTFNASNGSLAGGQVVNKASTTVGVITSSNPVGTSPTNNVMLTATVSPVAPGAGTRTGTAAFFRNGLAITGCGSIAVNASGQAVCSTSFTQAGIYNITVQYSGDGNFNGSNNNAAPLVQQVTGPTAAHVGISGRVVTTDGRGIAGARITLVDSTGQPRYTMTNPFGYYRFADVPSGVTYVLNVNAKGYLTVSTVREITAEVADLNITLQR